MSSRHIERVGRIWADGNLLRGSAGDWKVETRFRLHHGGEDQAVDPLIASAEGLGAPAHRGLAYAVFEGLQLESYGNRIPSLTFEVFADEALVLATEIIEELSAGQIAGAGGPALHGYAAAGESVAGCVEPLMQLSGLWLRDEGARARVGRFSGTATPLKEEAACAGAKRTRKAGDTLPNAVVLLYHDVARDFQAGLQRARTPGKGKAIEMAAPVALDAGHAKGLAESFLADARAEQVALEVRFTWAHAGIAAGSLVRSGDTAQVWRVRRVTIGAEGTLLELVPVPPNLAIGSPAQPGRQTSQVDAPHGPTVLQLLDVPLGGDAGIDRPQLLALASGFSPGWRKAGLRVSFDDGASWSDISTSAAPAILGSTLTDLAPASAALFQDGQTVDVMLLHAGMELESRDDAALGRGANLAAIGDELVQFGSAERIGSTSYRLSRLLRGRRGTEVRDVHVAGRSFAVLTQDSALPVFAPSSSLGSIVRVLASGVGDGAGESGAAIALQGRALRPPSPVHLEARRTAEGLHLSWVRRSRLGWTWADGDVPLGEERELYQVSVVAGVDERSFETTATTLLIAAADLPGVAGASAQVSVRQVGTHARSDAAVIDLML